MKKLILLALVTLSVSCTGHKQKSESPESSPKITVTCDSADMKEVDPKTGIETITRIWRCDSIVEETSK